MCSTYLKLKLELNSRSIIRLHNMDLSTVEYFLYISKIIRPFKEDFRKL